MAGDRLCTCAQFYHTFEIVCAVLLVRNCSAITIQFGLARPPASCVPLCYDAMDAIWGEEAIFDSLAKAVFVDRVAKVPVTVAIVVAQRGRGHAELYCWLEVFQNRAPGTVVSRASPVALIHDDQVEEIRGELIEESGAPIVFRERLIDGEVHLAALEDLTRIYLGARVAEDYEYSILGLVYKNVTVGEVENSGPAILRGQVPAHVP